MIARKRMILILFILMNIISIVCAQPIHHPGHKVSELNLTVSIDKNEIHLNQFIQIYFNFTNKEIDRKAYANNVTFIASLSKSLARPKEKMYIENNGDKESNIINGELKISSNFNKHNIGRGDWAEIRPDGTIYIYFARLDPGEKITVEYITKYITNFSRDPEVLFATNTFTWTSRKDMIEVPFIPPFKGLNYKPIIEAFNVDVKPEYNITCWNAPDCIIFEHSQMIFTSKTYDQDDENNNWTDVNVNYFDDKIDPYSPPIRIKSGDKINDSGIHQFQINASDSIESNSTNNSTYFRVIDIGNYHKGLIYSFKFIFCMLLSLLVPLLIIGAMRYLKKCKDKNYIGLLLLVITFAYVFYFIYYIFLCRYYQDTVILESITLSVAYLVLLYYYLCIDKEPKELLKQKFGVKKIDNSETIKVSTKKLNDKETDVFLEVDGKIYIGKMENEELYQKHNLIIPFVQIFLMGLFTVYFHYYLPEILSNSHAYLFLSALGLAIGTFILAMKKPICKFIECVGPEKDSLIRIGFTILAFLYTILISIYDIKDSGVAFSPKFGLLEIIIIICTELMPLLTVAIAGMSAETVWDFMALVLGDAKKS